VSDPVPASVLARQIADALEDDYAALDPVEGPHGITEIMVTRQGYDAIYDLIVKAIREGGIST
jgi:hypothetical protein